MIARRAALRCAVPATAALGLYLGVASYLTIPPDLRRSDVIVVLGGDGPPRAVRAAALFRAGLAPRILVSGDGDCWSIRDDMIAQGVGPAAIVLECGSGSTYENAVFSSGILARMNVRSALMVTSWFHLRRALACFSLAAPSVRWRPAPAAPPTEGPAWALEMLTYVGPVAKESLKLAWYAVRYRILPASSDENRRRSAAP